MVEAFSQILAERHKYAQAWKERTGGKVVGYLCTYVPEELIYAAGMLPVRILGSHEPQDLTDRHISPMMWCAYCRDCLAQGLQGRYNYLDGLVYAWCCQHIRMTFDSWRRHCPLPFTYQLYVPNSIDRPSTRRFMVSEIAEFKEALERWGGKAISQEALEWAIGVYNTHRRLMQQVYQLRKAENPPVSGAEAMEMVLAGVVIDKAEHNQLVQAALNHFPPSRQGDESAPRLMLLGSENDDVALVRFIESLGARVVIDEHCTGSRYFWGQVSSEGDLLAAIVRRYLDRPPCPQKDTAAPQRRRLGHILELAREYRVQGAIIVQQKFCDPYRYENPLLQTLLPEQGIPSLLLEVEVTLPQGQFRVRVEAFLETLQKDIG